MNRDLIKNMYEAGLSLRQIEKQTGIPYSSVRERLIEMGVEMRKRGSANDRRLDHEAVRTTAFLYEKMGLTTTEIGEKLGIAHDTVCNRLKHHGVEMRDRHESARMRFARRPKAASSGV